MNQLLRQIFLDLPIECSLISGKGTERVGSVGGGDRSGEGKWRPSGRTRGGPVKKRLCGVLVILLLFLYFFGVFRESQGRPCQEEAVWCGGIFGLLCNNSNLGLVNNVYSHAPHHTC